MLWSLHLRRYNIGWWISTPLHTSPWLFSSIKEKETTAITITRNARRMDNAIVMVAEVESHFMQWSRVHLPPCSKECPDFTPQNILIGSSTRIQVPFLPHPSATLYQGNSHSSLLLLSSSIKLFELCQLSSKCALFSVQSHALLTFYAWCNGDVT